MPPDRSLRRPVSRSISRSAHAAAAHRWPGRLKQDGAAAGSGVFRSRPLHGPHRRRDRRHRRAAARHRGGERTSGRARLCGGEGQRHRDHRHRPFSAASLRRLVPPPRPAAGAGGAPDHAGRRFGLLPRHAGAADQGRRLSGDVAVASAAEALAAIRSGARVDVVVTDIEMPDMDGFELAAALRRRSGDRGHSGDRAVRHGLRPTRSSADAGSASTISSPSSIAPG